MNLSHRIKILSELARGCDDPIEFARLARRLLLLDVSLHKVNLAQRQLIEKRKIERRRRIYEDDKIAIVQEKNNVASFIGCYGTAKSSSATGSSKP
jgi:hypothetical protein